MLEINTEHVKHVSQSDWLYGFILHYLEFRGEMGKHDLMARVQRDVSRTFPNLDGEYFYEKFENSDNIFMTLFYFAIFHLREKGYGLIKQRILKNEPVVSLSPIGHEFLRTPEGKEVFIDYQDIEAFLRKKHPDTYAKARKQVERYRSEIQKLRRSDESQTATNRTKAKSPSAKLKGKFTLSLRWIDIIFVVIVATLLMGIFLIF